MVDYPLTTWVYFNKEQVAVPCTAEDLGAGKPTILDGLSFTWGRSSTVDQPDTETCTFTIREQLDRDSAITTLIEIHAGSEVEIWTAADVPVSNAETMTWTEFDTPGTLDPDRWQKITGETPTVTVKKQGTGYAAWIGRAEDWDWTSTVIFPPAELQPEGTNPNAWDLIPQYQVGQVWQIEAHVWLPPGAGVQLSAYVYTSPSPSGTTQNSRADVVDADGNPVTLIGDGQWHTLKGQVSDTLLSGWLAPALILDPMPSPQTWTQTPGRWQDQVLRWQDLGQAGVDYLSLKTEEDAHREVLVWSGEVTSMIGQAAGYKAFTTAITCSDLSAPLANLKVGDEPWPVMSVKDRVDAITALLPDTIPPVIIDDALQPIQVSYRDVDAQPPLGLLQDLAQTAGGVMWVTSHATQWGYLWMEDPATRASVLRFVVAADGTVSIGERDGNTDRGLSLISARDILRDPVAWTQDVSQTITQASVSWLEQLTDEDGHPTTEEHTEVVQASQADRDRYGLRDLSVSTELISANDADNLASRLLAQARNTGWIADGLNIDTSSLQRDIPTIDYPTRLTAVLDLLDATTRIGRALTLIEVPEWTPADAVSSMYVEGGTYTWADHRWQLELTVSPAAGQGESATWADFDGTNATWSDFAPNRIVWTDAYGVAGPTAALAGGS